MGAHRDGRLCYLERRNHAIALALYRAAETTATCALRERAGRPLVRLVLVRCERERGPRLERSLVRESGSAGSVVPPAGWSPEGGAAPRHFPSDKPPPRV